MTETLMIGQRFNGPPDSGNGGYSCGLIGKLIDGPAVVRLSIPPPLDVDMEIRRTDTGVEIFHDDVLVGSARPATVEIDIPSAPGFSAAETASRRYRGFDSHYYPGCFVCGPEREHGDGLRVFAGPVKDNVGDNAGPEGMVAATWVPDESLLDESGKVASEYIWSVLDCPGAYCFTEPSTGTILLGEIAVAIQGRVSAAEKCVVIGWEIDHQGRKHHTGTALFGETGECCALARATWFEVPLNS